jgi:hypothetical protein
MMPGGPVSFYLDTLLPIVVGAMALVCLGVGLRGLATRRPFVFSTGWFLLFLVIVCGYDVFVNVFLELRRAEYQYARIELARLIEPAVVIAATLFVVVQLRGYVAVGLTGPVFHEALRNSIKKLGLQFEMHFSTIRLPSTGGELQVSVQSWIGTARLRPRKTWRQRTFRNIAHGMNGYFKSHRVASSTISGVYCTIIGVFLVALAYELMMR